MTRWLVVVAALLTTIATRSTWFTITAPRQLVVVRDLGNVDFGRSDLVFSGAAVAGDVGGLALLAFVIALLTFLVSGKARAAASMLVALTATAVAALSLGVSSADAIAAARASGFAFGAGDVVEATVARWLTIAAALGTAAAAAAMIAPASRSQKVSLPETGPVEEQP